MKRVFWIVSLAAFLAACSGDDRQPGKDKLKADLVGRSACDWSFDSISEFRKIDVTGQTSSKEIVEYDLGIEVEGGNDDRFITARAIYKKRAGEWILSSFNESGCTSTQQIEEQKSIDRLIGVWSRADSYPTPKIEITRSGTKFEIRHAWGRDSQRGTTYLAKYEQGKLTAIGNEKDFYKWTLPTFEVIADGNIRYNHGAAGPEGDTLVKTDKNMPDILYSKPVNGD